MTGIRKNKRKFLVMIILFNVDTGGSSTQAENITSIVYVLLNQHRI